MERGVDEGEVEVNGGKKWKEEKEWREGETRSQ